MVYQRLYVGEDALGVGLVAHDHHVLHLQQRHAVGVGPEEEAYKQTARMRKHTERERTRDGADSYSIIHQLLSIDHKG